MIHEDILIVQGENIIDLQADVRKGESMGDVEIRYDFSPTALSFIESTAVVNVIISGFGEGKTWSAIAGLIAHAERNRHNLNGRPMRVAIVRDTHENIKNSLVISIQEFFEHCPQVLVPRNDWKKLTILIDPPIEADLFGIDDLASLGKLQGPEYAMIWLNEPAPMADSKRVSAGLPEEVYNAALVRCARQRGTIPRLQIDMNPADEEHWTYRRLVEAPAVSPDNPLITKSVFFIPYGENKHLKEVARQAAKEAYKHDPAAYARYVEGKFAIVYQGLAVTPYYQPELHLASVMLEPAKGLPSFRLWDSWQNPCCILGQQTATGRIVIHNVLMIGGSSDIRTLISAQVEPLLNSPRWKDKARDWRDIGDRTMLIPDQSNISESAARVVENAFGTIFEPGPSTWEHIKRDMDFVFQGGGLINGRPSVILCPVGAKLLDRALRGAWHYPTDISGNQKSRKPVKNDASHPGDAFANGCAVLRPAGREKVDKRAMRLIAERAKQRIRSYATGLAAAGGIGR